MSILGQGPAAPRAIATDAAALRTPASVLGSVGRWRARAAAVAFVMLTALASGLGGAAEEAGRAPAALGEAGSDGGAEPHQDPDPARVAARTGERIVYVSRPVLARELHACSFRRALCVHASGDLGAASGARAGAKEDEILALLAAADRAWDVVTGALALPAPETAMTSTGAFDLYLVEGDSGATRTELDLRDPRGGFDSAGAFARVGRGARAAPGCSLDGAAARAVARAVLYRVAPATDEGSALAESAYLASLMVPCAPRLDDALLRFQAHPELGLADTLAAPSEGVAPKSSSRLALTPGETYATGASLFYEWVDGSFGAYPGAVVRALWALSPTLTPAVATRWNDEPDGFDVLRMSFKNALTTGSSVDDLWLDFAVARAFESTFPVRLEWSIAWPTGLGRVLASGSGVAPTGAAYVAVDCGGRPTGARLRVEAHWEEHARMLWTLVRVDAQGREISRVAVPGPARGTDAQTTLVDLDGVARVLIVGSNAGDPLTPFDPDDRVWEPHGWALSVAGE